MNWISNYGQQLYHLLPAEFRARDNSQKNINGQVVKLGDLAKYLDSCGELLDSIDATLQQRLADIFPDNDDPNGSVCQDWVLPYLAELLDVRLVSPSAEGQREEIANAVAWRKGKGTENVAEQIAEAVAQIEVEMQQGWQRVALTPRIGMPLIPATALGEEHDIDIDTEVASRINRHPGLPVATVDLRRFSRAIKTDQNNPVATQTVFNDSDEAVWWRQANRFGIPCFPGSFEDVSRRTVDIRDPDWRHGHYHPKRLLIFYPPEAGFFPREQVVINWSVVDGSPDPEQIQIDDFERETDSGTELVHLIRGLLPTPLRITGVKTLDENMVYRFENVCLDNTLTIESAGRVEFENCAVRNVIAHNALLDRPVLTGSNSLFERIQVGNGLVRLEYCTMLRVTFAESIQASDCIFVKTIRKNLTGTLRYPDTGCIRYSSLTVGFKADHLLYKKTCAFIKLIFFSQTYKEYGAGVLHPATSNKVCYGAEDGGEMGAFHAQRYCLGREAVIDKLADYLPVGIEAALIPDQQFLCAPPETTIS